MKKMSLKPQDVLIVLKLIAIKNQRWSYSYLSSQLLISTSEVHAGVRRAVLSHLLEPEGNAPIIQNIEECLIFGVRYSFPPFLGGFAHGMPSGYGAPPLSYRVFDDLPPVWKNKEGEVFGYECSPIYHTAPDAARTDSRLYELLCLLDALRIGKPRERGLAGDVLVKLLRNS
jgi:hypothetical protein